MFGPARICFPLFSTRPAQEGAGVRQELDGEKLQVFHCGREFHGQPSSRFFQIHFRSANHGHDVPGKQNLFPQHGPFQKFDGLLTNLRVTGAFEPRFFGNSLRVAV